MTTNSAPVEPVEHRLALVMNGGVSLAVWMGGVALEIDNARRASNGLSVAAGATAAQKRVHEAWAKATQRAGTRLSVDVIAGTSAGGLNGVLLAAAIARGASLVGLRELWLEAGQLSADALFKPQDEPQSLMNGDFFHKKIAQALAAMTAQAEEQRREVSLIVTSTALSPSARPLVDSAGHRFSEADHRRRFHFTRHRARAVYQSSDQGFQFGSGPEVDHFATDEPLATAARATASFPVAFKPVRETKALRRHRIWPNWTTDPKRDWLADGGILDNSPFDAVLESIEHKPVDSAWRRTVCYVDPSADDPELKLVAHPGRTEADDDLDDAADPPPPWPSVAIAAFTMPGEIDFRDDVEQLHHTIRAGRSSLDVRRFRAMISDAEAGQNAAGEPATAAENLAAARRICAQVIELYRQSCTSAAIYQVRDLITESRADGYLAPAQEIDKDIPLFPQARAWLPAKVPSADEPLPAVWDWAVAAAARVLRVLLRSTSPVGLTSADDIDVRAELSTALDQVTAIERALNAHLAAAAPGPSPRDAEILKRLDESYAALNIPAVLASIIAGAVTAYAKGTPGSASPTDVLAAALAVEVGNGVASLPTTSARPLFDFDRLGLDDPPRLLLGAYRAALDAPSHPSPNNILYGSRVNHFAAFALPDWRRWDWLWGRLNGLQHLAHILGLNDSEVDELTEAIIEAEGRDLESVRQQIGEVIAMDKAATNTKIERSGDLPSGLDALLALLRSDPRTRPPLPRLLVFAGQALSDVFARHGHQGKVEHEGLRLATGPVRRILWAMLGHTDEPD